MTSTQAPSPRPLRLRMADLDSARVLQATPFVAAAMVLMWAFVGIRTGPAQWGDNFEQFIWAHSLEWGYYKHPPLPTWLLAAAIEAFGPSIESARGLAVLCILGTGVFTYLVARDLFGRPTASLALLFWGLQHPFSHRCLLFNHNTVLMLVVSAAAWCGLRASRSTRPAWWAALGILAGLAVLSKYQAVVPLAGIVLAMALSGGLRPREARVGLALATLIAMAMLLPHALWMLQHDFTTLAYATQQGHSQGWPDSAANVASFLAQQLRLVLPALVFGGLLMAASRCAAPDKTLPRFDERQRAWMIGLVALPLAATLLTGPLLSLKLQNHWGYQALQFVSLLFAWRIRSHVPVARPAWVVLALTVHVAFLGLALMLAGHQTPERAMRDDARYPARELAIAIRRDWQDDTSCPLSFVVGPSFEAGMVSVYSGGTALVLEDGDFSKSPWIKPSELLSRGAVHVATSRDALPSSGVTRIGSLDVSAASPAPYSHIHWAIVPPLSCGPDELRP